MRGERVRATANVFGSVTWAEHLAARAAHIAQASWRRTDLEHRARILRNVAQLLHERAEDFDAGLSAGRGAVRVGGRMVDGPIAARARRLIELADQIAGRE